ncbi:MAG: DUF4097 family beta strand repeat-containing protein [Clostridium sp.]
MKKFMSTKIKLFMVAVFIGCVTCFISGFVVLANSGYTLSNYSENIKDFIWGWEYNNNWHRNFNSSSTIFTQNADNINSININLPTYSADIFTSSTINDVEIVAEYNNGFVGDKFITSSLNDGILTLSSLDIINSNDVYFRITIPASFKGNLSISTANGDVDLSNLNIAKLSVKSLNSDISLSSNTCDDISIGLTNGNINLNNNKVKSITIDSINSEMYIYDTFETIKIVNTNGDIDLSIPTEMKNCDINNISGDIELHSNPSLGFIINYETISGDMERNIDGIVSYTKNLGKHSLTKGNADSNIFVKTVSGDLSVD